MKQTILALGGMVAGWAAWAFVQQMRQRRLVPVPIAVEKLQTAWADYHTR